MRGHDWSRSPALQLTPQAVRTLQCLVKRMDAHEGPWHEGPGDDMNRLAEEAFFFLYDHHLVVSFAWPEWEEGREILYGSTATDRFASLDRMTVLKLLTCIVRSDRFSEGAWASGFDAGAVQALFRRLLEVETGHVS